MSTFRNSLSAKWMLETPARRTRLRSSSFGGQAYGDSLVRRSLGEGGSTDVTTQTPAEMSL